MTKAIDFWVRPNSPYLGISPERCVQQLHRQNCFKTGVLIHDKLYLYLTDGKIPGRKGTIYAVIAYNPQSKETLWQNNYPCLEEALEQCQQQVNALSLQTPCQQNEAQGNAA
ncbi:hypothetical protein [Pseudoteredinibacter isoporae]|uniref:Uncharacterized protein n=1 Tax=Pseudoteredinibacter isoporae TaxID=570281 RepID=A0A7X0MWD5_9GAMM|nr:hypothetical protein [Pseudoteredinibacter isoporae]MBB6522060.1 hypothetical protein [Pseudoteredinibacter isoporae]NHO87595.1 hypothetical protein [Pseudoteredinibacter isoporae]NIB24074.1 hypothetical protein [Pseudoteredinibacter isoporae]